MCEDENQTDSPPPRRGSLGLILFAVGGTICLLMALEEIGGLPFDMPRSWYGFRAIWLGLAVSALVGGFLLQAPPPGDEANTD